MNRRTLESLSFVPSRLDVAGLALEIESRVSVSSRDLAGQTLLIAFARVGERTQEQQETHKPLEFTLMAGEGIHFNKVRSL